MQSAFSYSFESLFRDGPAAYIILAPDAPLFTILDVNSAYLRVTRKEREQLVGKGIFEVFPSNPELPGGENDLLRESLNLVLEQKEQQKLPMHRYDILDEVKGGYVKRYWTGINTPIFTHEEKISCIVHSPLDVTYTYELSRREKEIVKALHKQRNNLFHVFKQAPVGIGIFRGENLQVELANNELCYLLGTDTEAVMGKSVYELLADVKAKTFMELVKSSASSINPFVGYEVPLTVFREGKAQEIYINFAFEQLQNDEQENSGLIVVANEVSSQVIARKKLEESEQRFKLAISASNMGIWDIDLKTGKAYRSERHAEIFGHQNCEQEWSSEILFNDICQADRERIKKEFNGSLETGYLQASFRIDDDPEHPRWIEITGEVKRDEQGNATRMLGTVADVSKNKELEKLKDEFISTVSHEIKTPVTSIKAYGQLLQRKMLQDKSYENIVFLKKMDTQISRLTNLVHHLLDSSRMESNKILFKPSVVDLSRLCADIVEEIQQICSTHTLEFEPCPEDTFIMADAERLRQVIVNMLTNSIKYSPKADKVVIRVYKEGSYVCMCVKDFGIGISGQQQKRIFERFYQAEERGSSTAAGLGLGLYISHQIIIRHEGEMWVTSKPGEGAEFFFKIPLHTGDESL